MDILEVFHLGIINTFRFNAKYFGLKGVLRPRVLVARNVILANLGGSVILSNGGRASHIGFSKNLICVGRRDRTVFSNEGTLRVNGRFAIFKGASVIIRPGAELNIGDGLSLGQSSVVQAYKRIDIGRKCTVSWDCLLMDSDTHPIYRIGDGQVVNENKAIIIGDHVWICSDVKVLKGAAIPEDSVIAAGAIVTKPLTERNTIYIGNTPVKGGINFDTEKTL